MIDPHFCRSLYEYAPDTGKFFFKERARAFFPSDRAWRAHFLRVGSEAGCLRSDGYVSVVVGGKNELAHRVAWAVMNGGIPAYPVQVIDHINGDKSDNRIANLRLVSHLQNMKNLKVSKANTSGVSGVTWYARKKHWRARIGTENGLWQIGCFKNFEDAVAARRAAEKLLGFTIRAPRSAASQQEAAE